MDWKMVCSLISLGRRVKEKRGGKAPCRDGNLRRSSPGFSFDFPAAMG
jgi:hypothetical protein